MKNPDRSRYLVVLLGTVPFLAAAALPGLPPAPWGEHGHLISGRAAAVDLPEEMPEFFRTASAQLSYLNPEPDRWRNDAFREMNEAFRYDHYVDIENLWAETIGEERSAQALSAGDRFQYLDALFQTELERPVRDSGFLHLRMVELYQRLVTEFRLWREAPGPREREWIEARILNDAGILGHYVTDGAQPHHTTIHFNGWSDRVPNPEGYTTSRDIHWRFESTFVRAHVTFEDVLPRIPSQPRTLGDVQAEVWDFLLESNGNVEELYRLERDHGFDPDAPAAPETKAFVVDRLVAGVEMLRAMWWSAWLESGIVPEESRGES
jgi:hypothetical protein